MKKPDVQLKVIDQILPYKMEFEKCWGCGGEKFFVVFTNFKSLKPEDPKATKKLLEKFPSLKPKGQMKKVQFPYDLATDVQFWCVRCGDMSSGVFFNEDMVNMKSRAKKLKLEDVMTPEEAKRLAKALKEAPLPT